MNGQTWREQLPEPYRNGVMGLDSVIVVILDRLESKLAAAGALVAALEDIRDMRLPELVGPHVQRSTSTQLRLLREMARDALAQAREAGLAPPVEQG